MRAHRLRAAAGNVSSGSFVTDGLIQHFDFSDTNCYASSGATAITDLSGNSNNMTFAAAPTLTTSSYGSGGRHIEVASSSTGDKHAYYGTDQSTAGFTQTQGTNPFTIEFWLNAQGSGTSVSPNYKFFIDTLQTMNFSPFSIVYKDFDLSIQAKMASTGMSGSSQDNSVNNGDQINIDSSDRYNSSSFAGWEHFVAVRENTSTNGMKYYRNGSLIKQDTNSINYAGADSGFFVSLTECRLFRHSDDAKYAIFRRYVNKGLTATEVQQHYDLDKGRFGLS